MINLIVATTRNICPSQEWFLSGVRRLVTAAFHEPTNWILYDRNPDLLNVGGPQTRRLRIFSNTFHHQTLLPFDAAIVAGGKPWLGEPMELFYGLLAKQELPLWLLGVSLGGKSPALTESEKIVLSRNGNFATTDNETTLTWLSSQGIRGALLPSPTLFWETSGASWHPKTGTKKVTFILEHSQKAGGPSEAVIRGVSHLIARSQKNYDCHVVVPTVQDFMRFSTMFPEQVDYSYEARDYVSFLADSKVVVTFNKEIAIAANGLGIASLWIADAKDATKGDYPFIRTTEPDTTQINAALEAMVTAPQDSNKILTWKQQAQRQWTDQLKKNANLKSHANSSRQNRESA